MIVIVYLSDAEWLDMEISSRKKDNKIRNLYLSYVDITGISFVNRNLTGTNFSSTTLIAVNFSLKIQL
jgi:uncharacterized protein YjbI with pentapeptide repeats